MKVRILIDTHKEGEDGNHRAIVWEGDMEIIDKQEYLMMISLLGEGQPQPLCQAPFTIGIGHYIWVPPESIGQVNPEEWENGIQNR